MHAHERTCILVLLLYFYRFFIIIRSPFFSLSFFFFLVGVCMRQPCVCVCDPGVDELNIVGGACETVFLLTIGIEMRNDSLYNKYYSYSRIHVFTYYGRYNANV